MNFGESSAKLNTSTRTGVERRNAQLIPKKDVTLDNRPPIEVATTESCV